MCHIKLYVMLKPGTLPVFWYVVILPTNSRGPYSLELMKKNFFRATLCKLHNLFTASCSRCKSLISFGSLQEALPNLDQPCMKPWWSFDRWMSALPVSMCLRETPLPVKPFYPVKVFIQWEGGKRTDRQMKWKQKINTLENMQTSHFLRLKFSFLDYNKLN